MRFFRRLKSGLINRWWQIRFYLSFGAADGENVRLTGSAINNIKGKLHIASNVLIRSFNWNRVELAAAKTATLSIGANSFINQGVRIVAIEDITIGANVQIGDESILLGGDFHSVNKSLTPKQGHITIEDGAWLATRVIVLRGCTIGENAVVAAGSVVTKNIPSNSFAAGVPARVLKTFN